MVVAAAAAINAAVTPAEVRHAAKGLPRNRAAGEGGISPATWIEVAREPSGVGAAWLAGMMEAMLAHGFMPEHMCRGLVTMLPKPNKPTTTPASFRPITVLPSLYRLFDRVLAIRTSRFAETTGCLGDSADGFRPQRNCGHAVFTMTEWARAAAAGGSGRTPAVLGAVPDPAGYWPKEGVGALGPGPGAGLWLRD